MNCKEIKKDAEIVVNAFNLDIERLEKKYSVRIEISEYRTISESKKKIYLGDIIIK